MSTYRGEDTVTDPRKAAIDNAGAGRSLIRVRPAGMVGQIIILSLGVCLGFLSFLSEVAPAPIGALLTSTLSTGSAWALTAFVASILFSHWKRSVYSAIASLIAATITYYFLIVVSGVRSGGFAPPIEGAPGTRLGLLAQFESMANGVLFWIVLSIVTGLVVGWLGYTVGSRKPAPAAVAAGLMVGVLVGPAIYPLTPFAFYGVAALQAASITAALVMVVVATVAPAVILALKSRPARWVHFIASACLSSIVSVGVWHMVEQARIIF